MPSLFHHIQGLIKVAGFTKAATIVFRRGLRLGGTVTVAVANHGAVEVRPIDSDLFVLSQIFGWKEYDVSESRLLTLRSVASAWRKSGLTPVIVDAGSNVGYSSLYFARLFPEALVIAIEPNPETFNILNRHTRTWPTIKPIHAALWSHNKGLELTHCAAGAWADKAKEGAGTPSMRLDEVFETVPNSRPLIIKLDIEGAEREVVESCPDIFAAAQCIMVEPHDFLTPKSSCLSPLYKVAASKEFDTLLSGENLMLFAN